VPIVQLSFPLDLAYASGSIYPDPNDPTRFIVHCESCNKPRSVSAETAKKYRRAPVSLCLQCANSNPDKRQALRIVIPDAPDCIILEPLYRSLPKWRWTSLVQCPDCHIIYETARDNLLSFPRTYCTSCQGKRQRKPLPDNPDCVIIDPLSEYRHTAGYALVQCPHCSKTFSKSRYAVQSTQHTICLQCHRAMRAGPTHHCYKDGSGHRPYGPRWNAISANIRERDNHRCQFPDCAVTEYDIGTAIPVHHIVPFETSHDNSSKNLICLCPHHHGWADHVLSESIPMFDNLIMMMYGPDY
jgi:hypothetical protein